MSDARGAKSVSSKTGGSMLDVSTASASMAKDPLLVKIYESLKQMRRKQAAAQSHANGGGGVGNSRSSSVSNLSGQGASEKSSAQSSSRKVSSSSSAAAKAASDLKSDATSLTSSGFGSTAASQRAATRDESSRAPTERSEAAASNSSANASKPPAASSSSAASKQAAALKPRTRAEMEERKQKLALQAQSMLRDIEQLMRAKKAAAAASANAGGGGQLSREQNAQGTAFLMAQARGDAGRAQSEAGRMGPTSGPARDQSSSRDQPARTLRQQQQQQQQQQQPHAPTQSQPQAQQLQQQQVIRLNQVRQSPPVRMQAFSMPFQSDQQQQQLTPVSIITLDKSGALVNGAIGDANRAGGYYAESPHAGAVLLQQQPGGGATVVGRVLPSGHVSLTPNPPQMGRSTGADEQRMSSSSNALGLVEQQQQQQLNYVHLIPVQQQQPSVEYRLRSSYPDLIPVRLGGAASATTLVLGATPTQGTLYITGNGTPQAISMQPDGSQSVLSISSFHRTGSTQSTIMESGAAAAARDADRRGDAIDEREEDDASGSERNADGDADGDGSGSEYCSTCGERVASQSGSRSGSASNLESVASTARSRMSRAKAHQSRSSSVDTVRQQQRHAHKHRQQQQQHQQAQTQQEPEKRLPEQRPARTSGQNPPQRQPAASSSQQPPNRAPPATRNGGPPPASGRKSSTLSTVSSVRRPIQRRNVNIQCNRLPAALFAPPPAAAAAEPKRKCPSMHRLVNECELVPVVVTRATAASDWGFRVFESVYVDAEEVARTANLPWSVNGKRPVLASSASAFSRRPDSAGGSAETPNAALTTGAAAPESLIAVDSLTNSGLVAQAALGGLRERDFLVELDGALVTDVPLVRVQQLLSQSRGTRLALVVARYKPPADSELSDSALKSKSKAENGRRSKGSNPLEEELAQVRERYLRLRAETQRNELLIRELKNSVARKAKVRVVQGPGVGAGAGGQPGAAPQRREVFQAIRAVQPH